MTKTIELDLPAEKQMHLVADAIYMATGQKKDRTTAWRWATTGQGGTVLRTWMLGGRRVTTIASVKAFMERRTEETTPSESLSDRRAKLQAVLKGN